MLGITIAIALALVLIVVRVPTVRFQIAALGLAVFAWIAITIDVRGLAPYFASLTTVRYDGDRYGLFPIACVIVAAAIVLEALPRLGERGRAFTLCGVFGLGAIMNFDAGAFDDLQWSTYAPAVDRWIALERAGLPTPELTVPINPSGWSFSLPATR
jgi:hypothetical protein